MKSQITFIKFHLTSNLSQFCFQLGKHLFAKKTVILRKTIFFEERKKQLFKNEMIFLPHTDSVTSTRNLDFTSLANPDYVFYITFIDFNQSFLINSYLNFFKMSRFSLLIRKQDKQSLLVIPCLFLKL